MARCGIIPFPKTFLSQSRILRGFHRVIEGGGGIGGVGAMKNVLFGHFN